MQMWNDGGTRIDPCGTPERRSHSNQFMQIIEIKKFWNQLKLKNYICKQSKTLLKFVDLNQVFWIW